MFCRMTRYSLHEGRSINAFLDKADELRMQMEAIGAHTLHTMQFGENGLCTIALYRSEGEMEAALEPAKAIWRQMADTVDLRTMKIERGEVVFSL